jgi:hypothetical protein
MSPTPTPMLMPSNNRGTLEFRKTGWSEHMIRFPMFDEQRSRNPKSSPHKLSCTLSSSNPSNPSMELGRGSSSSEFRVRPPLPLHCTRRND